jgi:putative transposase
LSVFLEKFAQENRHEIHIIQLDNAPVHTAHKLVIPENIILLFQPPYCPELNAIERVWQYIKQQIKNIFYTSLDDVKHQVAKILNS